MDLSHERTRRAMRAHFRSGNSPRTEHAMFDHIGGCDTCRSVYEQYAALVALDPAAPSREDRLLRGLGLARPKRLRFGWIPLLATAAAATVAVLLVVAPWAREETGFHTRGGESASASEVLAYRVSDEGTKPLEERMAATDALAFAYANPEGRPYLLVFAVSATSEVHWYYPAWSTASENPTAVRIEPSEEPRELGEAIKHEISPGPLHLVTVLANSPMSVREVESAVAATANVASLSFPNAETSIRTVQVD